MLYTPPERRDKTRAMRTHTLTSLACLALALSACNQGTPANDTKAPASAAAEKKAPASELAEKPAEKPAEQPAEVADAPEQPVEAVKAAAPASAEPAGAVGAGGGNAGVKVSLLEAGAEPRQTLRLKLVKGASNTAEMLMTMQMKMNLNGMTPPEVALPPTRMLMKMDVTDAADNLFNYTFEVTEAAPVPTEGVQPMVMDAMTTALKGAVGLKGKGAVDARGMNQGASFELPAAMDPQTRQLMDGMRDAVGRMSAPLPEEAIGVGGKWKVDQALEQNGMTINQTATYTITGIEGDVLQLSVEVSMDAPAQEVKAPGMPEGAKMMLESMTGKGTGKTTLNLGRLLPDLAEVNVDTAMKSQVEAMGQKQNMSMDMKMGVVIKPAG